MSICISILGSTGSIGRQTLDVVDKLNLRVAALTANRDVDRLEAQCRKFRPQPCGNGHGRGAHIRN